MSSGCRWSSGKSPRRGRPCPAWLTATELLDRTDILHEKTNFLLRLLRHSRRTLLVTGAGLSTSAGVRQAARGSQPRTRFVPLNKNIE